MKKNSIIVNAYLVPEENQEDSGTKKTKSGEPKSVPKFCYRFRVINGDWKERLEDQTSEAVAGFIIKKDFGIAKKIKKSQKHNFIDNEGYGIDLEELYRIKGFDFGSMDPTPIKILVRAVINALNDKRKK